MLMDRVCHWLYTACIGSIEAGGVVEGRLVTDKCLTRTDMAHDKQTIPGQVSGQEENMLMDTVCHWPVAVHCVHWVH